MMQPIRYLERIAMYCYPIRSPSDPVHRLRRCLQQYLKAWMQLSLLAVCLVLSGCIPYPIYKQLQPNTQVRVVDATGMPIAGAAVTLISSTYRYSLEDHRETLTSDAAGSVAFKEQREWRIEILAMHHGPQEFLWNLCVCKPGYSTYTTPLRSSLDFNTHSTVVLQPGTSTPCPPPRDWKPVRRATER